jgi:hypothetical protein
MSNYAFVGYVVYSLYERGVLAPPAWGFGAAPPRKKSSGNVSHFLLIFCVASIFVSIVGWFFVTWFFSYGFLFPIKDLGLLTNPSN